MNDVALKQALRARAERDELLRGVKEDRTHALELIDLGCHGGGDPVIGRIPVGALVLALKGVDPMAASDLLAAAGIDEPDLHLSMLRTRERDSLKDALHGWFDGHAG